MTGFTPTQITRLETLTAPQLSALEVILIAAGTVDGRLNLDRLIDEIVSLTDRQLSSLQKRSLRLTRYRISTGDPTQYADLLRRSSQPQEPRHGLRRKIERFRAVLTRDKGLPLSPPLPERESGSASPRIGSAPGPNPVSDDIPEDSPGSIPWIGLRRSQTQWIGDGLHPGTYGGK